MELKHRIANLLTVKSIVTLCLTGVFAYLSCNGQINQNFMTIYTVIIAFYFGTQASKKQGAIDEATTPSTTALTSGGEKWESH